MALVAVYGTLKDGFHNHKILEEGKAEYIGTTVGYGIEIYDLHGMFPVAKKSNFPRHLQEFPPVVEIYDVDVGTMTELDVLEGVCYDHPASGLYHKDIIHTEFGECTVYIYNDDVTGLKRIINWGTEPSELNLSSYVALKMNAGK